MEHYKIALLKITSTTVSFKWDTVMMQHIDKFYHSTWSW